MEPDGNPFEALDDMDDKDVVEKSLPEDQMTGTRVRHLPPQYNSAFRGQRYDDTSEHIHIQVDDVMKIKLP